MSFDVTLRHVYPVWTRDIIRYRDLDPNTHVNHTAIAEYFENGRVRLRHENLTQLGEEVLTGFMLAKLSVQFRKELRFPGEVEIGTGFSRLGTTSYTLTQGLFQGEVCVANSEVVTVFVSRETGKPTPLTEEIRAAFAPLAIITS